MALEMIRHPDEWPENIAKIAPVVALNQKGTVAKNEGARHGPHYGPPLHNGSMQPSYETIADLFGMGMTQDEEAYDFQDKDATPLERGFTRLNVGLFEKAIEELKTAVEESDGTNPEALFALASAYAAADHAPQAIAQFKKALEHTDQATETRLGLSAVHLREGETGAALQTLREAIAEDPKNSYTHYKYAEALARIARPTAAWEALQPAIVLAPDQAFYHAWGADLLIKLKRFDEAVEAIRAAVELSPGDDGLYQRTAVAFWGAGRRADAVKAMRLASDLDPARKAYAAFLVDMQKEMGENNPRPRLDQYDEELVERWWKEATP